MLPSTIENKAHFLVRQLYIFYFLFYYRERENFENGDTLLLEGSQMNLRSMSFWRLPLNPSSFPPFPLFYSIIPFFSFFENSNCVHCPLASLPQLDSSSRPLQIKSSKHVYIINRIEICAFDTFKL